MSCKQLCENEKCVECFNKSFASSEKSKWWSNRNDIQPFQITKFSKKKYEFQCDICSHYFISTISNISRGDGSCCPFCSNPPRQLCQKEDCLECYKKSCESHTIAKWWSPLNKITPRNVRQSSLKKYNFICSDCNYEFISSPSALTLRIEPGCPHCSKFKTILCDKENCQMCFNRSFASHPRSKWWSERNKISPRMVLKGSREKYEFKCDKCNHYFNKAFNHMNEKINSWCPYCCFPALKLCNDYNCKNCFDKSFASHPRSKWWSEYNKISPRMVLKGSGEKYEFKCAKNHIFRASITCITRKSGGTWCPKCINKTEEKLYEWLLQYYPDVITQYKAEWCKSPISTRPYFYDFYIPSLNIIIEIDGPRHFENLSKNDDYKVSQSKDLYKIKMALNQGISIIRIPFEFIYKNEDNEFTYQQLQKNLHIQEEPRIHLFLKGEKDERYKYIWEYDFNFIPEILRNEKFIEKR